MITRGVPRCCWAEALIGQKEVIMRYTIIMLSIIARDEGKVVMNNERSCHAYCS